MLTDIGASTPTTYTKEGVNKPLIVSNYPP
jgi:hypothetical protein